MFRQLRGREEESNIYTLIADTDGAMYFGYSIESWVNTPFGSIDKNQIKIGGKTYTIAGLHENDQDDNKVILAVSDYIDYENTQVYICKENDRTIFSIDRLAYDFSDTEGGYIGYILNPLDTYLFHLNWSEVPKTFRLWIADTLPPWYDDPNYDHSGGADITG